jgi:hypothetical protein
VLVSVRVPEPCVYVCVCVCVYELNTPSPRTLGAFLARGAAGGGTGGFVAPDRRAAAYPAAFFSAAAAAAAAALWLLPPERSEEQGHAQADVVERHGVVADQRIWVDSGAQRRDSRGCRGSEPPRPSPPTSPHTQTQLDDGGSVCSNKDAALPSPLNPPPRLQHNIAKTRHVHATALEEEGGHQ